MNIPPAQLKTLLLESNLISEDQWNEAERAGVSGEKSIEDCLIDAGSISDEHLGQLIANNFRVNYTNLSKQKIPDEILQTIPEAVARAKGILAFAKDAETIRLGMVDPNDIEIRHFVEKRTGLRVLPFYITMNDFQQGVSRYEASAAQAIGQILEQLKGQTLTKNQRDHAIIELVDTILHYAQTNGTSDIHIDPAETQALIRFRIDGILNDIITVPKIIMEMVVARVKILAKMRTDEHRSAQDGKISFEMMEPDLIRKKSVKRKIDVRVSIVPTTQGENIVMRLLSATNRSLTLDDLGLGTSDADSVRRAIKNPVGMILVTGPTGSGKTTTLYSILKILNKRNVNIATIEDPVEYAVEGVTQIQVNPKTNLTFANGLRAIVRQDPNIIMVGEIRDHETADIAVNSAMTGHLVLSTLHTNNAATTLPRLLDMGIEPFLLTSTIHLAMAQRLVRKICENCRTSYLFSDEEKTIIATQAGVQDALAKKIGVEKFSALRLYRGEGCRLCEQTGYVGRIGIFEVLRMSQNVKEAVLKRASSNDITAIARSEGMTTMIEDGIDKVIQGVTTISEVLRVAGNDAD